MSDYTIRGQRVSEISCNEYPSRNSLFYMVNPGDELSSESIKYANLSSRIVLDIVDALGFGSMAHEEKYLYSLSSHNHDKLYSRVSIKDLYTDDEDKILSIANITIQCNDEVSTYSIVTPKIQTYKYAEAGIGTLKFVAVNRNVWKLKQYQDGRSNVDVDDEDFDGWVFPNGGYIDSLSITLPDLSRFVKLSNEKSQRVEYKNAVAAHGHLSVSTNLKVSGTLDMYRCWVPTTSSNSTDGRTAHQGGVDNTTAATIYVDFARTEIGGRRTEGVNPESMIETKPNHNLMPVMIYIGKNEGQSKQTQLQRGQEHDNE